jgi:SAM-dependent methyltransferase
MTSSLRRLAHRVKTTLTWQRHRRTLHTAVGDRPEDYRAYLDLQLKRTLDKQDAPLQPRTQMMVDRVAQLVDLSHCRVLCVGCRNASELDYFAQRGARQVTGIDLYSTDSRIQVMDMHQMTFADHTFDLVYSTHALEHAYDPGRVAAEIVRVLRPQGTVALEVPVQFEAHGADLVDYGSLEGLHRLFAPHVAQVVWSEELPAGHSANSSGTAVARTIFTVG